jgi:hypothetical protein
MASTLWAEIDHGDSRRWRASEGHDGNAGGVVR